MENDLETVINKYNILNNFLNNLKIEKNIENKNLNDYILNNRKNIKPKAKTKLPSVNNSKEKNFNKKNQKTKNNKHVKNILITENTKNLNCFDNEYINNLKKENEKKLKKIIIKWDKKNMNSINFNKNKKSKERNNIFNNRFNKRSESKKRPISRTNSKDHSYIGNYYHNKFKNIRNNINNRSEFRLIMNKTNYSMLSKQRFKEFLISDESIKKNKNKNNQMFNTISSIKKNEHFNNNSEIKKFNTFFNKTTNNGIKSSISNQRLVNKLKVTCKTNFNEKLNSIKKRGEMTEKGSESKDKKRNKYTPKHMENSNRSFFSHSNNKNIKIKNKLKYLKVSENDSVNNDFNNKISATSDFFFKHRNNNNYIIKKKDRLTTEINRNNKSRLIILRNTDRKKNSTFNLNKEFNTEKKNFEEIEHNNNFLGLNNENELSNKNSNKIQINKKNHELKLNKDNIINEELTVKKKTLVQKLKKINNNDANNNNSISGKNNLYNCLSLNNINKKKTNKDNKQSLNHKKKITPFIENSYIKTNQLKNQNKTINNINNFNNCNYIYLLNNGDKFIKINRQFKI